MSKCSFCGKKVEFGTGIDFVTKGDKTLHFCSSKCRKNTLKLKRKPIHTKWTKYYKK